MESLKSKFFIIISLVLAALSLWQIKSVQKEDRSPLKSANPVPQEERQPAGTEINKKNPPSGSSGAILTNQDTLIQALRETKECYHSESCDFPQTDPKSYDLAVGQKLKDLLKSYRVSFAKDPRNQAQTESIAREYITSEDEFVQEVALEMMSELPPSEENLKLITESLHNTTDPLLVEQAMNEMKRHLGTEHEPLVHQYLKDLVGRGAVFSSEQAVRGMFAFINAKSFPAYAELARSLPASSSVGRDLKALLEEYQRQQTGG